MSTPNRLPAPENFRLGRTLTRHFGKTGRWIVFRNLNFLTCHILPPIRCTDKLGDAVNTFVRDRQETEGQLGRKLAQVRKFGRCTHPLEHWHPR